MKELGLYIHIPFCKKKCKYCDFISFECKDEIQEKYVNLLIKEIQNCKYKNRKVTSIYIGGGTPSYINSIYIKQILDELRNIFLLDEKCEITIEINPGTINKEKLIDYKNAGINRISIGLQSTNNRLLKLIGRIHTYEDFLECYELIKEEGFKNINIDLMLALPTQTEEELNESVEKIVELNPNHISIYSLILEEGTLLKKMVDNKELEPADEITERKMYWSVKKYLEIHGYNHYEISNFAKESFESKHNFNCWNQEEYIGFGVSAHSYINNKRFSNTNNLKNYINNIERMDFDKNIEIHEIQDRESMAKEYMLLGFRKIEGISISEFERKFRINPLFYFRFEISKLVDEKLIEVDLDKIKLTNKGIDFANLVFEEFI